MNLDDKTCTTVRDRKKVTCATVNSCLRYNGVNLPPQIGEYKLMIYEYLNEMMNKNSCTHNLRNKNDLKKSLKELHS